MKKTLRRTLVTLGIAILLFGAAIPAQAASLTETAEPSDKVSAETVQEGVDTQELEYTVVTDKAGMLSEAQIKNIEEKVAELENCDAGLYIEKTDRKTCTQSYTNKLSEQMYSEIFGDYRNGVMIVFSFYEEAGGYYAVHYGANVPLSERKISNIIEGTYHDFKTDATWVEGSFCQCVDYLKTVKEATSESNMAGEKEPMSMLEVIFLILLILAVFVIGVLAFSYHSIKVEMKDLKDDLSSARNKNSESQRKISELEEKISSTSKANIKLQNWKKNAMLVRPMIQDEIDDRLAKDEAAEFDHKYSRIVKLEPVVENFDRFDILMSVYEKMSDLAKSYVKLDINTASRKRQESGELYAKDATQKIENVCSRCTGSRHDRSELNSTVNYYNGLPLFVRLMIAQSLISRLNESHDKAEAAQRRYNSSQSSYNHSSSHSGSSFGSGFHGGGTFGGGFHGGH